MTSPGTMTSARVLFVALSVVLMHVCGCGYQHEPLFPQDVNTVSIPIFENRSFYQGVEFDLTEALVKEIELRTPYKVTGSESADSILQGTIVSVDQSTLSRRREGGLPQELEMRLVVDFEWKNLRNGQTLAQRRGFKVVGRYIPARPVAQPLQIAQHRAVDRLAQEIVAVMRSDW